MYKACITVGEGVSQKAFNSREDAVKDLAKAAYAFSEGIIDYSMIEYIIRKVGIFAIWENSSTPRKICFELREE